MPVVINEFEAVAEPAQARSGDAAAGAGEPTQTPFPAELREALRQLAARRARVRAH
ncbi:MAG: hypothetical protein QOJ94_1580 [Sphingomonadales bacterium]|jgi:hypothetical protein|nr:hypothetical protein [Sphingomonadales bacterium]